MTIYEINPLEDSRWAALLEGHPRATVFHTTAWLEALRRTYGYTPVAFTTCPPGAVMQNGLVFCRVESWLTGHRLVSLPFSDHCDPLVDDPADLRHISWSLLQQFRERRWRYIEIRPLQKLDVAEMLFQDTERHYVHHIDLRPSLETLFRRLHKDSTQRKIRRAEREGLTVQEGRSDSLLHTFYHLHVLTRRRHQLPPQPLKWFRNLIECFGEQLMIRAAFKAGCPVSAILTLCFRDTLVYKYGCSDVRTSNLGGTHLLFWSSIAAARESGLRLFDLGRSAVDNTGLITFKDRWGADRSTLTYARYPAGIARSLHDNWKVRVATQIFTHAPAPCLSALGNLLYRHIG